MDQLKVHQLHYPEDQYFAKFWRIYTESFPLSERRIIAQQTALFTKSAYHLNGYTFDNLFIGFISFWTEKEFIFIEHLAISPELRSKGFGNAVLKSFFENNNKPIILEIELPADSTSRMRLRFYESLGFQTNGHNHCQPPYHSGDAPIPMKILSLPVVFSATEYRQFARFQQETVMA